MGNGSLLRHGLSIACATAFLLTSPLAHAALTISKKPTENVTCTATVCSATAAKAVLNAKDLTRLLKKNDVTVVPGSIAKTIVVGTPLHWTSAHKLTLDAFTSISINRPITVEGSGSLTLTTSDGGSGGDYGFGAAGNVEFWDTSDGLTINGVAFTLAADLPTLIADIAGHGSGAFALAKSYDASVDGTYAHSPITTPFAGTLEGLGNAIANLSINDATASDAAALFKSTSSPSVLRHLSLTNVSVTGAANTEGALVGVANGTIDGITISGQVQSTTATGDIGGLAGVIEGTLANSSSSATVQGGNGTGNLFVGGLVGEMFGSHANLMLSDTSGTVVVGDGGYAGGLVGGTQTGDTIQQCYSTSGVTGGTGTSVGALVAFNGGSIAESFATGGAAGGQSANAGGLVGRNVGTISQAYSTGPVSAGSGGSFIGGLIGADQAASGSITSTYWDTETSGISDPGKGAGNRKNDPGITGLTSAQFQAGLPTGFDSAVWAESAKINNGFPYLRALRGPG